MLNKFTSLTLMAALLIVLCGTSAFASDASNPDVKADSATAPTGATSKNEAKPNEPLRNNMLKLVADAKAGKVVPAERPQIQTTKSNNLSKGAKVAIGVGIAVAVIAVILIVRPALNDGQ